MASSQSFTDMTTHSGQVPTLDAAEIHAQVLGFVTPKLVVKLSHVGGVYGQLKAMLEFSGSVDATGSCPHDPTTGVALQASLNAGLQIDVGAFIDINVLGQTIFDHSWGPMRVYNGKKPILGGCMMLGAGGSGEPAITPGTQPMVGQVYQGTTERIETGGDCWEYASQTYTRSLQIIAADENGGTDAIVGTNGFPWQHGATYSFQDIYHAQLDLQAKTWMIGPKA